MATCVNVIASRGHSPAADLSAIINIAAFFQQQRRVRGNECVQVHHGSAVFPQECMLNGTVWRWLRSAHDLTRRVNSFCVAGATEGPEIGNHAVSPDKRMMALAARWAGQIRGTDSLSSIVDPTDESSITAEGTYVRKDSMLP